MKKENVRPITYIVVFLGVAIVFLTRSSISFTEFLIFLFSGMLIGINLYKLVNKDKG